MLLPAKKSLKWLYVFAIVFLVNLVALALSRSLLGMSLNINNADAVMGFVILALCALIIGVIASLGYLGIRIFSFVFMIADLLGIIYVYYIIISGASDGLADLVSIVGFLTIIGFGSIAALIAQAIYWAIHKRSDRGYGPNNQD